MLGYTLPGFATSARTLRNAHALMKALGVSASELDIRPSATQMLRDLGHPAADGEPQYDVTYENVQAGERTSHLFRLANYHSALVLGTGDLSASWRWAGATYGVGDQMSHYSVNASVPKTLIQFLLRWAIDTDLFGAEANAVLDSVLDTAISPGADPRRRRRRRRRARAEQRERPSAPTSSRTSSSTTSCASATGRARSRSWPSTPGATATAASGPT